MLKSMDILHDNAEENPLNIYSATLEYTCNVEKLRNSSLKMVILNKERKKI